jgi:Cu(I)/Ag(I) efflux system membrane fusion protein
VKTGREAGDQTEVVEGLQAGQQVVRSGQFLIDSEASLRGLVARLTPPAGTPLDKALPASAATAPTHRTDARVEAVDGDTVTLDHPPIASLKWPQMVMDFRLPLPEQRPRNLKPGERVQIEFRMQDGDVPQITSIQRLAPGAAK